MPDVPRRRVQVVISGRVQGVGFRMSCQRQAVELGVTGWVRNRWDGAVEALLVGAPAAVDQMLAWCHHGPPMAVVTDVAVIDAPDGPDETGFRVR